MPFTWDEICTKWILQNCHEYDQEECVHAFTIIEKHLGRGWLEEKYKFMKGPVTVIPILKLGEILGILETHKKFDSIRKKIRQDTELDLASLAAFYVNQGLEVAIEPEIEVEGKTKVPDLMVTFGTTSVYFEVYKPSESMKYRALQTYATDIAQQVLDSIVDGVNIKIYLIREPSKTEVENLINACKTIQISLQGERQYSYGDLAKILIVPRTDMASIDNGKYLADDIRRFLIILGKIHGKGIQKACLVGMPFTDKRVDRILRNQYPQLSKTECNVVAMDLTSVIGEMDLWAEGLLARFRGNNYRRIGAVILSSITNDVSEKKTRIQQRIIIHPNPRRKLPDDFFEITEKRIWN